MKKRKLKFIVEEDEDEVQVQVQAEAKSISNTKFQTMVQTRMQKYSQLQNVEFKQHQYDGVKWCIENELQPQRCMNVRGGIIADEMGTGKTITMIGLMKCNLLPRTLIVVPAPLVTQWENQIKRIMDCIPLVYHGTYKASLTAKDVTNSLIVITTYGQITRPNGLLHTVDWSRIIFDEAHHLRNRETNKFEQCLRLKACVRWLLTGTPIQNREKDFHNLCLILGIEPSVYLDPKQLDVLCEKLILRRTKESVHIHLPEVTITNIEVEWSDERERRLAENVHHCMATVTGVNQYTDKTLVTYWNSGPRLLTLLRARQACILPQLMAGDLHTLRRSNRLENRRVLKHLRYTSKIDAVVETILWHKGNGNGKLVFCHFRQEIDLIAEQLVSGGMEIVVKYDGRSKLKIEHIPKTTEALIMQIQKGCEGLNLQDRFSEVYFVSPTWNPFIEDQAIARCHRIGQQKPVKVFRFYMSGFENEESISLESHMMKIQSKKRKYSEALLNRYN